MNLKNRSYGECNLDIKIVPKEQITNKKRLFPTERRALKHELSDTEPLSHVIILDNKNKETGRMTTRQVKEMLSDIGFNVSPIMSEEHGEDFSAVMNIKGFFIPGWNKLPDLFPRKLEKFILTKYSPGKERLHVRFFENNDGSWLIASHTDHNWINPNLVKIYKSHFIKGAGNYKIGTVLMFRLLNKYKTCIKNNKVLTYKTINRIVKDVYRKGTDEFYKSLDST